MTTPRLRGRRFLRTKSRIITVHAGDERKLKKSSLWDWIMPEDVHR